MAVYVVSDVHGHLRALDKALDLASPGQGDALFVMGDMVDRGPDPMGVIDLVRSYPGAHVLLANHERMMLDVIASGDPRETLVWELNGGSSTARGLDALSADAVTDLVDWLYSLPTYALVQTDDLRYRAARPGAGDGLDASRIFILVHAGIDSLAARVSLTFGNVAPGTQGGYPRMTLEECDAMMGDQDPEDLLWIREGFWSKPTGLVGRDGLGPVVVAGHTPSVSMRRYATLMAGTGLDESGYGCMVEVGATADTGGEPDRVCIDCSAATGHPFGRVGIMRLDDRRVWYANVEEGE